MASCAENASPEELLSQKHKRERKDLQAQIQKLKHSVPKGDKKKKKEVTVQVAQLEAELDAKQQNERDELTRSLSSQEVNCLADGVDGLTTNQDVEIQPETDDASLDKPTSKKPSRAQKRREKKGKKEREREELIKQQEVENLFGVRHKESQRIRQLLKERTLKIHEVPSDGNCLYAAIQHQLNAISLSISVEELRRQTADHMRTHCEDFLPFLCHPSSGDPMSIEDYEEYCHRLATQPEWGGQLEIQALSCVLGHPIEVIQAEGPSIKVGEDLKKEIIILSYHRHAYQLGEHYNSVIKRVDEDDDDDDS